MKERPNLKLAETEPEAGVQEQPLGGEPLAVEPPAEQAGTPQPQPRYGVLLSSDGVRVSVHWENTPPLLVREILRVGQQTMEAYIAKQLSAPPGDGDGKAEPPK